MINTPHSLPQYHANKLITHIGSGAHHMTRGMWGGEGEEENEIRCVYRKGNIQCPPKVGAYLFCLGGASSHGYLKQRAMASAAAVASSRREALATPIPVRSHTMVWKFMRLSSLPWASSAW